MYSFFGERSAQRVKLRYVLGAYVFLALEA